jgi:hypothetical protein
MCCDGARVAHARAPHASNAHGTSDAAATTPSHRCAQKTAAHFADLRRRYGDPVIVLNLLKSKERRWVWRVPLTECRVSHCGCTRSNHHTHAHTHMFTHMSTHTHARARTHTHTLEQDTQAAGGAAA